MTTAKLVQDIEPWITPEGKPALVPMAYALEIDGRKVQPDGLQVEMRDGVAYAAFPVILPAKKSYEELYAEAPPYVREFLSRAPNPRD